MEQAPETKIHHNNAAHDLADRIAPMHDGVGGAFISHLQVENWTGTTRPRTYGIVARANRILQREHGIFLVNHRGKGYQIARAGEEVDVCREVYETGVRRIARGVAMANHIKMDRLTEAQKSRTLEKTQQMANVYGLLTG